MLECVNHAAEKCPRYHSCNASYCPLSGEGLHLAGEKICHYLLSSGKDGAAERFRGDPIFAECKSKLPQVASKFPEIGRRVEVAAKSGFPGQNLIKNEPQKLLSGLL
jgi:hypothetical protein